MILPTKRIPEDRALIAIGGEIIQLLSEPKTISRLWEEIRKVRRDKSNASFLTYDWFILSIDFLFTIKAIELRSGSIEKVKK